MYGFLADFVDPFMLLFLLTIVAVATLWCRRQESRRRLLLATVPLVGLTLVSMPVVSHLACGLLEWQNPPLNQLPAGAQAIVVLAGGVRPPDEVRREYELAEDTILRCMHAADLYRAGPPRMVIASGGHIVPDEDGPAVSELMHGFLARLGVAEIHLLEETRSRSTYENALYTAKLLEQHGIDEVILVTEATHLPRAISCFEAQGVKVTPSGCDYRTAGLRWSLDHFLPSSSSARGVSLAIHEWLGMMLYWIQGKI